MATKKKLGDLDATNYREWAKEILERYNRQGQIVDAMVWARIVALYEEALKVKGPAK